MVDVDTIVQVLAPAVTDLGLDLYDVDVTGSGRARILRVMVDREGGVDLEAIAAATQAVSPLLDAPPLDAVIAGPYALEVSSPGLERPLRTPAHFARAVGETVSVKTRAGDDHGPRRVRGVVTAADDAGFDLALDDATVQRVGVRRPHPGAHGVRVGTRPRSPASPRSPVLEVHEVGTERSNSPREPVRR